ncbi:MAG: 23S rRNA (pseudouridine(1915)-N(3))-methyltransferase RlmH, partial [Tannerella sp.]|nr:23S rRNA (pseudouridine(1915)-N(3))-methyltransferase RlmH [Tannerella sp.]
MKITFLVVGKTDTGYWDEALKTYEGRLTHYIPFETEVIPDVRKGKRLTEMQQKTREGECILKTLQAGDSCVLLDEKGQEYTSVQFASYIEK